MLRMGFLITLFLCCFYAADANSPAGCLGGDVACQSSDGDDSALLSLRASVNVSAKDDGRGSKKLAQIPFLMAHDAASAYPTKSSFPCGAYQTQEIGFSAQLDCGVRAFDLRVNSWKKGDHFDYQFNHGEDGHFAGVPKDVDFILDACRAIAEFTNWAKKHPDELILLFFTHMMGDAKGWGDYKKMLQRCEKPDLAVPKMVDCVSPNTFGGKTWDEAMKLAKLSNGGHVLAMFEKDGQTNGEDCYYSNFNTFEDCDQHVQKNDPYGCVDRKTKEILSKEPEGNGDNFWAIQGIYQNKLEPPYTQDGPIRKNRQFTLNKHMMDTFGDEANKKGGLWLVDNICTFGKEFAAKIGTGSIQKGDCTAACNKKLNSCR